MHTMNKEKQCMTSKKDGKLLRDIFFNIQSFHHCPGPRFPITMNPHSYDHSHEGSCEPLSISLARFPKLLLKGTYYTTRCECD